MNNIHIFNSPEFGEIRTVVIDGEPWFVGRDIAKALGYAKPEGAVTTHCRHPLKQGIPHPQSPDKEIEALVIPEGDMYRLISKSKLKSAERFEEWVFDEVLPTIRKTGAYGQKRIPMTIPEQIQLLAQGHVELEAKIDSVKEEVRSLKENMPILPVEAERITNTVKAKGVHVMGGKASNAYANRSIVNTVYRYIYGQIYRNFGVRSYKAIRRNQTDKVVAVVESYVPPVILQDRIDSENAQQKLEI